LGQPHPGQSLMRERNRLAGQVEAVRGLERDLADAVGFAEMADEEGDEAALDDARAQLAELKARAARAELEALLAGEADGNDAYVEINSGAGAPSPPTGANMLLRMYTRWAGAHGFAVELIEDAGRTGRESSRHPAGQGNQCLWLAEDRGRGPPAGAHLALRPNARPPHELRLGLGLSGGRRCDRDRDQSSDVRTDTYRASGAGRPAHQQDRFPPSA